MQEWSLVALGDLIDVKHGFAFKGEFFRDAPPGDVLLTPGNFAIGGGFQFSKLKYYDGPSAPGYVLEVGDLLVTMTDLSKAGDTLGYPATVPQDDMTYLHNQRLGKVMLTSDRVSKNFVYWLMRTDGYRAEILASCTGSTVKHTSPGRIRSFKFLLPSRAEQELICLVLGSLDDKIELNRRMNETLEAMAQAIFRDWFIDFGPTRRKIDGATDPVEIMGGLVAEPERARELASLFPGCIGGNGLPEGWDVEPLLDQAQWINGAAYKNMHFSDAADALPVVKIAELKGGVTASTKRTASDLGERYRISNGDLLFSWSGNPDTSIDAFIWTGGKAWLNQHIFAVRQNGRLSRSSLYILLKWLNPQFAEIARNKQTTGLGHVTKEDMRRLLVCVAPRAVEAAFGHLTEPMIELLISRLFENNALAATRDFLLPKLMSGEIRLEDARAQVAA